MCRSPDFVFGAGDHVLSGTGFKSRNHDTTIRGFQRHAITRMFLHLFKDGRFVRFEVGPLGGFAQNLLRLLPCPHLRSSRTDELLGRAKTLIQLRIELIVLVLEQLFQLGRGVVRIASGRIASIGSRWPFLCWLPPRLGGGFLNVSVGPHLAGIPFVEFARVIVGPFRQRHLLPNFLGIRIPEVFPTLQPDVLVVDFLETLVLDIRNLNTTGPSRITG